MKNLFILNEQPYGGEKSYNGLRLAVSLGKSQAEQIRVFLMGDGAPCGVKNQKTPQGYYNIEHMLKLVGKQGGEISVCGSCMDARGIADDMLAEGARRGTMAILTEWTAWADKILVF
ncbi:MAG: DsrE family protein [Elusimicrobia bacterium]|nr:DsrE family protein [Elusimicrobiota bacterium]